MVTIRAYTTIEQCRKLAEILPLESADMGYNGVENRDTGKIRYDNIATTIPNMDSIPCWSLAALLNVLPSATLDSSDDHYYMINCMERYTEWYDNSVDACCEMIIRLNELEML